MAFVNFATREITAKIVYYGPGLGGKTTSLQYIHNSLAPENRGKMISLATEEDRTIYFDFLPLHLGKIQDFAVRVQLYTVPGQVRYNATRKLVLRGADGLVFVADSQRHKKLADIESFNNMEENLREHGKDLRDLPHILQFNKLDLPGRMTLEELTKLLNKYTVPYFETCATSGIGILDALKSVTKLVFNDLGKKALLQKKAKTTSEAAASYSVESSFAKKSATPQPAAPSSVSHYYVESEYSSDLIRQEDMAGDVGSNYRGAGEAARGQRDIPAMEPPEEKKSSSVDLHDSVEEVEPIAELDEAPYENYEDSLSDRNSFGDSEKQFTYKHLFDSTGRFADMMARLEKQISANESSVALQTAKALYTHLLTDLFPSEYMLDGNESSIIMAMDINFKRFLRFKHLLGSQMVETPDLLFIHHFFCDLYLGLKEL